jgi:hypothetical protein
MKENGGDERGKDKKRAGENTCNEYNSCTEFGL